MAIKLQDMAAESAAAVPHQEWASLKPMNPENLLWIAVQS